MIIAGLGDDFVRTGEGRDLALGDSGTVTFTQDAEVQTVVMTDEDRGGNDEITGAGSTGDKVLVGQYGDDRITGGTGDDVIIGDLAVITFRPFADGFEGQSPADRVNYIEAIRADLKFDDVIFGDAGADFIMGGMGDDSLVGDDGQDILIGDTAILVRAWEQNGDTLTEQTTIDTNFAFIAGGYDVMRGANGPDIMIGGLGPDLFFGDTARDLIYSDGYAGIFTADWSDGYGEGTPTRFLLTSNFAGPGAIDVVSEAQQDSSIGSPLNYFASVRDQVSDEDSSIQSYLEFLSSAGNDAALAQDIMTYLARNTITEGIVLMMMAGADIALIKQALLEEIMQELLAGGHMDAIALEIAIIAMIAEYFENAGLADQASNDDSALDSEQFKAYQIAAE